MPRSPDIEVWSQGVSARWKPSAHYFRNRIDLLEQLQDANRVSAFRVGDSAMNLILSDDVTSVDVSVGGFEIELKGLEADRAEAKSVLGVVLDLLEPGQMRRRRTMFQFVVAIEGDYEQARKRVGVTAMPIGESLGLTDFAYLVDGVEPSEEKMTYQIEFGVVRRDELPARLSRQSGRIGEERRVSYEIDSASFPEVALFADSMWSARSFAGELAEFWDYSLEKAVEFVDTLQERLGLVDG